MAKRKKVEAISDAVVIDETPAAVEEPKPEEGSHAAAVGKKAPGYIKGHTDEITGVTITEHKYPFVAVLRFAEKPSKEVTSKLREMGFKWEPDNLEWYRPIEFDTQRVDRETHRRAYDEVRKMIRAERGITHNYGGNSPE